MKRIIVDIHDNYADLATFSFVGLKSTVTKVTMTVVNIRKNDYIVVAGDGKTTEHNSLAEEE